MGEDDATAVGKLNKTEGAGETRSENMEINIKKKKNRVTAGKTATCEPPDEVFKKKENLKNILK